MAYTKSFSQLFKNDANIAGGKGASLGEMLNADIPVPDGFVVLSTTFDEFIKATELETDIEGILDQVDHKAVHTVDEASTKIQEIIINAKMPKPIADEIIVAFNKLGSEFVAVRSSATAEDGAEHAWAGQLESYLNTTKKEVLTNVQCCWASLFTPRAIFYRFEKGLHTTHISVAVVIQTMINSEKSGIAFSVHPVTEDPNQLIIEAGLGLGEAIVSGSVTPDSYVIEKDSKDIIECTVNNQNRALYRKSGGGNEWKDLDVREANLQVLSNEEILKLSKIIMAVENHYGFPCDIEWVFEGGKFYIVQSRPITTLKNTFHQKPEYILDKIFTRSFNFPVVEGYYESLVEYLPKMIDFSFSKIFFSFNNGILRVYRNKNESINKLVPHILDKINSGAFDPRKFLKKYFEKIKRIKNFVESYKKINLGNLDNNKIIEDLISFRKDWLWGSSGMVIVYWLAYLAQEGNNIPEMVKNLLDDFKKARQQSERMYYLGNEFFGYFIDFISRKEKIDSKLADYLRFKEIVSYFNNGITIDNKFLSERQNGTYFINNEVLFLDELSLSEKLVNDGVVLREDEDFTSVTNILKGNTGNPGKVSGIVRIVSHHRDIDQLMEGEILVAVMTSPLYSSAINKSSAIITDEGGMLCHAAIISRELGKPCIVGTRFATKILHDGDKVEVDADKGIIRIIIKKNKDEIDDI